MPMAALDVEALALVGLFQRRAGCESCDGAVDRAAAGFATLQADLVAAMAKAGQHSARER